MARSEAGLRELLALLDRLDALYPGALALVAARLIATCALQRRESRGSHYRSDFPQTEKTGERTYTDWNAVNKEVV